VMTLNEKYIWRISVPDDTTIQLTDGNVQKPHSYLIFITSGQVLDGSIYTIDFEPTWNSKANFLVVITDHVLDSSEEIAKKVLGELWAMLKVLNSVFVTTVLNTSLSFEHRDYIPAIDTYTWKPQQSQRMCMELAEVINVDRWYWKLGKNLHSPSDLYTNRLPTDFLGCPLKVSTPLQNYYWVKNDKNESVLKYAEHEITFLEFVFKKLNFTMILGPPQTITSDYSSSVTDKLTDLVFSDFNLAIGDIPLMYDIAELADYTVSHRSYFGLWYVPCRRHESRVKTISRIFAVSVWILIAVLLFVASILTACMGAYFKRNNLLESSIFTEITACLLTLWAVTLGVSSPELPRTSEIRLFFILFVWYSLAVNTVFQTYFTSFLVEPGIEDSIKDFEEMLKSGIEFGFDPFFDILIRTVPDWKYTEAMKRRIECRDRNYCFGRVAMTGDFAYLDLDILKLLYSISHKSNLLCPLPDGRISIVLTMYMKKGDVLIDIINPIVTGIIEAGLYNKMQMGFYVEFLRSGVQNAWLKQTVNATLDAPIDESLIQGDYTPFTLGHLYIAFCFVLIGYALSVFVILGEILVYRLF
jgi:hypothetical protein